MPATSWCVPASRSRTDSPVASNSCSKCASVVGCPMNVFDSCKKAMMPIRMALKQCRLEGASRFTPAIVCDSLVNWRLSGRALRLLFRQRPIDQFFHFLADVELEGLVGNARIIGDDL